jgi:hypothetical protein
VVTVLAGLTSAKAHDDHEQAHPADGRVVSDRLSISLSVLSSTINTDIAVGRELGVSVDVESVLGYDEDVNTFGVEGFYRLSKKGALKFSWAEFDRASSGVLDQEVPMFDATFTGPFESEFDIALLSLQYRRSFVNNGRTESGFTVGLSVYDFRFALEGEIEIDDGMGGTMVSFADEEAAIIAPIPTLGFFVTHAIKPRMVMGFGADFLDFSIDEHRGRLFNADVHFVWFVSRNVGLGLRFSSSDIFYTNTSEAERFRIDYRQNGAAFFVQLVFGERKM